MSVGKVIEVTASSGKSFEKAIEKGVERAAKTVKNVQGAWVKEMKVAVKDGVITDYRVNLAITFLLDD
jgi:flavin-binding protein dodecin